MMEMKDMDMEEAVVEAEVNVMDKLRSRCPDGGNGSGLNNLDLDTPDVFDNKYYTNLQNLNGLLTINQDLLSVTDTNVSTALNVNRFAAD
ncbi:hypothetical protein ZIOFF_045116 [Zingiber officinale]|uniref:Plant heme peroxidase family profile domain-containing protein n=1 Tax=Zingiber officinale TaxID=94328 RepID=A0A8J5G7B3_ZINOF|nr:hypothetical protein ZIOFF_045116 [Zingiber officinale]